MKPLNTKIQMRGETYEGSVVECPVYSRSDGSKYRDLAVQFKEPISFDADHVPPVKVFWNGTLTDGEFVRVPGPAGDRTHYIRIDER